MVERIIKKGKLILVKLSTRSALCGLTSSRHRKYVVRNDDAK